MTIKDLKTLIDSLPDDLPVVGSDSAGAEAHACFLVMEEEDEEPYFMVYLE